MPRLSTLAEKTLLAMPLPLSKWCYQLGRAVLCKDRRADLFRPIFKEIAERNLPGDYLEFGVYRGSSFVTAYNEAQKHGLNYMRFFAFDSFRGLPDGELYNWGQGFYACSDQRFLRIAGKAGVDLGRVHVVKGFYEDSLTDATKARCAIRRAAVVHLDCNLYSSTAQALAFITDMVDEGTVLVFDDWAAFRASDEHGQRRAFREWPLADCFEDLYDVGHEGKGFLCTKRPSDEAQGLPPLGSPTAACRLARFGVC